MHHNDAPSRHWRKSWGILLPAAFCLLVGLAVGLASLEAAEKRLKVVCTLPTIKALTEEVGGERVEVTALARGDQDPHFVTPTPVLMKKTREADLFIENGCSLDLWADEVANGSGNTRIFRGNPGRVIASAGIAAMEIPAVISRELGDIHPQGNPHFWLDPLLAKAQAGNIADGLKVADPTGGAYYDARRQDFFKRIDEAFFGPELIKLLGVQKLTRLTHTGQLQEFLQKNEFGGQPLAAHAGGWLKLAMSMNNLKALEYHRVWVYFARAFGIQIMGTVEERPGIPPGPQHVRLLVQKMKAEKIPLIMVDNFYDPSLPRSIASQTGATVVVLPNQVEGETGIRTYFELIDRVLNALVAARK